MERGRPGGGQVPPFRPPAHAVARIRTCSTCEHYRFIAPHPAEVIEPITRWICVHPTFEREAVTGTPFASDAFAARAASGKCGPRATLYEPKARGLLRRISTWLRGPQVGSYRLLSQEPVTAPAADTNDCGRTE